MPLNAYFTRTRSRLTGFLDEFLERRAGELASVKPWGPDVVKRLGGFTKRGKMIRGGLVCLGYEMAGRRLSKDAVRAGAAIELVQSALLIHDDIMDRDSLRRGEPSIHHQYVALGEKENLIEPGHFGESMGICVGEIALFLALEVIASLAAPRSRARAALEFFGREFVLVGLGQMQDIYAGEMSAALSEQAILDLYRLKTARYSFSLPLGLGCLLAGGEPFLRKGLEEVGEIFGLIFQLRDDDLGLFGDVTELGKSVGSDIKQGKRTLMSILLQERMSVGERGSLESIFGNPSATERDIAFVRSLAERLGVREDINRKIGRYKIRAERLTKSLRTDPKYLAVLLDLLAFSLERRN